MNFFRPDAHSGTHLFGSYALVHWFLTPLFGYSLPLAMAVAWLVGLAFEFFSSAAKAFGWRIPGIDPRGGDWVDVLFNTVGCLLILAIG